MLSTTLDNQTIQARRFGEGVAKWCLFCFSAFAVVNYTCNLSYWRFLGPIWDKLVLAVMAYIALVRYIQGYRPERFAWSKYGGWYVLYCVALMLAGDHNPVLVFDGFMMDVEFILFGMLMPYIVDRDDLPKILYCAVCTSILLGMHGVFQYIMKVPVPATWLDVGESVLSLIHI